MFQLDVFHHFSNENFPSLITCYEFKIVFSNRYLDIIPYHANFMNKVYLSLIKYVNSWKSDNFNMNISAWWNIYIYYYLKQKNKQGPCEWCVVYIYFFGQWRYITLCDIYLWVKKKQNNKLGQTYCLSS